MVIQATVRHTTNSNEKSLDKESQNKNPAQYELDFLFYDRRLVKNSLLCYTNTKEGRLMSELWDIYDKHKQKTGRMAERDVYQFKEGEYHIVVTGIIMNSKNEILISQRAEHKKFGLMWECSGGSILAGETSLEGIIRELKEELGIEFTKKEAIFLKEIRRDKIPPDFKDLWLFRKDIEIKDITFPDGEAIAAQWVTIEKFMEMFNKKEIVPTVDFGLKEYEKALRAK